MAWEQTPHHATSGQMQRPEVLGTTAVWKGPSDSLCGQAMQAWKLVAFAAALPAQNRRRVLSIGAWPTSGRETPSPPVPW